VDRSNRVIPRRASKPDLGRGGVSRYRKAGEPCGQLIRIDVTFILPRRLAWLLAGVAIGNLHLPDGLLEKAGLVLRALLPG
jgi:hypothetical protein